MTLLAPIVYPPQISRACMLLDETPVFADMPDGFFRVVIRLIKKVNLADPFAPIFASRMTIAGECGKSVETVLRAIRWLEEKGLIERNQCAMPGNRGSRSPITPTQALLEALGLLQTFMPSRRTSSDQQTGTAELRRGAAPTETPVKQATRFERIGPYAIPSDLAWLSKTNGLQPTAILKLMALSRITGRRLSDVVFATRDYLSNLNGRALFAYIKALLAKDRDYGKVAEEIAESAKKEQNSEILRNKAISLEGRMFVNRDGSRSYRVEEGHLVILESGRRSVGHLTDAFISAIESGRLRALRT